MSSTIPSFPLTCSHACPVFSFPFCEEFASAWHQSAYILSANIHLDKFHLHHAHRSRFCLLFHTVFSSIIKCKCTALYVGIYTLLWQSFYPRLLTSLFHHPYLAFITSSIYPLFSAINSSSLASNTAPYSLSTPSDSTTVLLTSHTVSSTTFTASSNGPSSSFQRPQGSSSSANDSSSSFDANDLTISPSHSIPTASPTVTFSSASFPHVSSNRIYASSNGSSDPSAFPNFHIDQKAKNVPGISAAASYSASGAINSATPTSITSMRNPFNSTKPLNQTNVCGGPVSIASSLITSGIFTANDCLPLNWDQGVLNLPLGGNCSMSPGFDGYNAKSCSCVNSAAKWYHDYATATVTSQQCQSSYDIKEALDIQSLGCSYNTITELKTPYPAPTSCCDKCEVAASAVQLVYWPPANAPSDSFKATNGTGSNGWNVTAAPVQSAASYGVVENGYTL